MGHEPATRTSYVLDGCFKLVAVLKLRRLTVAIGPIAAFQLSPKQPVPCGEVHDRDLSSV